MYMYTLDDVREVHLEVTTRCNAACPQCPRNYSGGQINEAMPIVELTEEDVHRIFSQSFVRQLGHLYLCGNYGDPAVASQTVEILQYLRRCNPDMRLGLQTNGGVRPEAWWRQLAQVVSYCRFSIDGLEDTNHLYRRNVVWRRLIENARAFIAAGGRAEWDFIVFRHNQHQVEEAARFAREAGFQAFTVKRTNRFFDSDTAGVGPKAVLDREGRVEYEIAPPDIADYRNTEVAELVSRFPTLGELDDAIDRTPIECRACAEKAIYVSAEGLVFPCAYTAHVYLRGRDPAQHPVIQLLAQYGQRLQDLDARRRPLRDIVEGPFFQQALPTSWNRPSVKDGRLRVCARVCGSVGRMFSREVVRRPVAVK
jgi:MoaA/NifB/PqqE/SkfB family radical SAM enzyme